MNNNATDWKEVASEIILIIHNAQAFNKLGETKQVHESIKRAKAKYAAALKNEKENHSNMNEPKETLESVIPQEIREAMEEMFTLSARKQELTKELEPIQKRIDEINAIVKKWMNTP